MPIYVEVSADKAIKTTTRWTRKLPQAGRRGTFLMANRIAREIRNAARLRGHVVTGYLSSKKGTSEVKLDKDTWGIKMPGYTKHLEEGTSPHFIPRTWKTQLAAKKYGMSFALLRAVISGYGTRPHPFVAGVIQNQIKDTRELNRQVRNVIRR